MTVPIASVPGMVRYAATAALAGLTAAYSYYPSVHWIPIAIAVVGTLGIHVVPAARSAAAVRPVPVPVPAVSAAAGQGGGTGAA